jgi:hypothetical protein
MAHFVHSTSYYGGFLFGLLVILGLLVFVGLTLLDLWYSRNKPDNPQDHWDLTDEEWQALYERNR